MKELIHEYAMIREALAELYNQRDAILLRIKAIAETEGVKDKTFASDGLPWRVIRKSTLTVLHPESLHDLRPDLVQAKTVYEPDAKALRRAWESSTVEQESLQEQVLETWDYVIEKEKRKAFENG